VYSILPEADHRKHIDKWDKLKQVFGRDGPILLPVLSSHSTTDVLHNLETLFPYYQRGQVSGVFILSNNIDYLASTYSAAKAAYPSIWMGINLLGDGSMFKLFELIERVRPDGVWTDKSYLYNQAPLGIPELVLNQFERLNWQGLYFGGVMFKYQRDSDELLDPALLNIAHQYMDVLTTTGPATGEEISEEKLSYS
jgi:hypothetical protein